MDVKSCKAIFSVKTLTVTLPILRLAAQFGATNHLQHSEAVTAFFKDLSLQMAQTLPDKLVHHLLLSNETARVPGIQAMMDVILHMTDKADMLAFLNTYIPKMSPADQQQDELIAYLGDTKAFQADLDRATHLDIKDLVNSIKKGVLQRLYELAQRSQSDVLDMDDNVRSIKRKLISYKWIRQLTNVQALMRQLQEIRQERSLTLHEIAYLNQLIGLDQSHSSIDSEGFLDLLCQYGIIELEKSGNKNHRVVTFKAVSLSLHDLLSDPGLEDIFVHSDEVRFLCTDCFYIDASMDALKHTTWTSKNIAIKASSKIYVMTDCLINLSGTNGHDGAVLAGKYKADDGRLSRYCGRGDDGSHGKNGRSGTSGGNILISTNQIIHSKRLTLQSCGGKGGNGQHGGDGQNGISIPSVSALDLGGCPRDFMAMDGNIARPNQAIIIKRLQDFAGYGANLVHVRDPWSSMGHSLYVKGHENGVQVLFGTYDNFLSTSRYGFIFSKSIDGESADGGNAGIGGKGGSGGQAGDIDIITTAVHDVRTVCCCKGKDRKRGKTGYCKGKDGKQGKTGDPGRRDIVKREEDHLIVDGQSFFGTSEIHHKFIDIIPWERSSKTGELGNGSYYCKQEVSQHLDPNIDSNNIGFFVADRTTYCLTKDESEAKDGTALKQTQRPTPITKTKPIIESEINMDFLLFANRKQVLNEHTALLQSLEQLKHNLHDELQVLDTVCEKQHHKQLRHIRRSSGNKLEDDVAIRHVSRALVAEAAIPYKPDELIHVVNGNPWISQDDLTFFQSDSNPIQDKYIRIRRIFEDAFHQQVGSEIKEETSLCERAQEKLKNTTFSAAETGNVCCMLDAIFVPIVRVMHFQHTEAIDDAIQFLTTVREKSHFQFHHQMDTIKATVDNLLFKQYRWCILAEIHIQGLIHDKHIAPISHSDTAYQAKSVTVYTGILDQTSTQELRKFMLSLDKGRKINPYHKPLPRYGSSLTCDSMLPLSPSTRKALEMLMVFINEANSSTAYVPDILSAVQEEYATFRSTTSDLDLLFIMTYLQDKLVHRLDKAQLEDVFCKELCSKVDYHTFKEGDYIIHNGKTYRIDTVDKQPDCQISIFMKSKVSAKLWGEWLKDKTHWSKSKTHHLKIQPDQVILDDIPIAFPNDELLVSDNLFVSPIDINEVWDQLQQLRREKIPEDSVLEGKLKTLSLPCDVRDDYKDQLINILRLAREAQDIPYDVFSFFPPSQWVEQLILYATQYQDHDPNFAANVKQAISGLSRCVDKTLYFTFFNQFLRDFSFKNECNSTDILEALQVMKSVFIDRQLSSLVTQHGIAQAWPKSSAKDILTDLKDIGLIDITGSFLSDVTTDTIQFYCKTRHLSPDYLNTVYTMQQYSRSLLDKELSFWNYKMHELRLHLDLQDMVEGDIMICDEVLMCAQQLVRHYGNDTVSKFMSALNSKKEKVPADKLQELFEECARKEWIFDIVIHQLKTSHSLAVILDQLRTYNWELVIDQQCTTVDIIESIKSQLAVDLSDKLDAIITKVNDIKRKRSQKTDLVPLHDPPNEHFFQTPICEYTEKDIKDWAKAFVESPTSDKQATLDHPLFEEAFAVICRGVTIFYETVKRKTEVIPRDTQMVASILFFQNLSVQNGEGPGIKLMQQISTGEGKTMIICMTAIFKALLGEKVNIVTSSSVLATRDAFEQKFFFDLFGISVSHCCHEERTRRQKAYESDVIYGDIGSFQRDILETDFYGRKIRTAHAYDNVFIDEVDSMLVDKGETMLYLPHALPDLNALDQVYLEIWSLVNAQDFIGFPDEQDQLHEVLKLKLIGGLSPNAFTAISHITEEQSDSIHRLCIDMGLIDGECHCLTTEDSVVIQQKIGTIVSISRPIDMISPEQLQQEMMLVIQQRLETAPLIKTIPEALHSFIKKSLRSWIQSAVNAKYFRPNKEYIIDIDRRESAGDRYPKIVIMDNETGVEQESSEWGSGLHQFLQLKHNLRLSTESLKAVYMSNITFFKQYYTNVMGVTGTLGSTAEHTLFNKLYENIQLVVLPTNKPSRLRIDAPVCCSTPESWEKAIFKDVQAKLQYRAVLLICEDVERARHLHQHLKKKHPQLELYTSSHQKKLEETGNTKRGRLIIATNIAGRGTDLKLSDEVRHNGGLHVCLSYLPPNVRVEQQAYGRAARSGDRGSCKLIFHDKQGDLNYAICKRDLCEAQRVADIEADYYHNIQFQEELFEKFTVEYEKIKAKTLAPTDPDTDTESNPDTDTESDKHNGDLKGRPELDYCLDCWAFFLDQYSDAIESIPDKLTAEAREFEKKRLRRAFDREVHGKVVQMVDKDIKEVIEHMKHSPARLLQLGHSYMKQAIKRGGKYKNAGIEKHYKTAIKAYQKAKVQNPVDPFAKYYEAAAQFNDAFQNAISKKESVRSQLKQTFHKLIPLFQNKIKRCRAQITILQLANRHQEQFLTGDVQYFDEQKQHEMEVYHQYIETMQDIVGKGITPKTFDHADWGEEGAVIVFEMVKDPDMFELKGCRVSRHYRKSPSNNQRLKAVLAADASYHTYQSKIENRIQSLIHKRPVTKHDFMGVFPDKRHFWDQLKRERLITHESVPVALPKQERVGYWNPSIDRAGVQFDTWDCIDADSFDWIQGLSYQYREALVTHLETNHVLNEKGQLIKLDLSKPLDLPKAYMPYYKHIKDTLWIQSIYRFVLDHLHDCVVIDMSHDIDDSGVSDTPLPDQLPTHDTVSPANSSSVVDIVMEINPAANASSSSSMTDTVSFTKADHIPNKASDQAFVQQLLHHNLRVTKVSGDGLNCLINVMIQHAKRDYQTHCFKEDVDTIHKQLQQQHLPSDDHSAEAILSLVNNRCHSTIKMVSVVISSSVGPVICGSTSDKRFSTGRHVVIWQQGNHFVSIVHHHDMVRAIKFSQCQGSDQKATSMAESKVTQHQLSSLERLGIIKKNEESSCQICVGLDTIEHTLQSEESGILSKQDKEHVLGFLRLKLEIDIKTLNMSPRQLLTDQHHVLYDDLCQYAVIKPVKMKEDPEHIDLVCYDRFGYNSHLYDRKPYFDVALLNDFLKQRSIEELTGKERNDLENYLQKRGIITHPIQETFDNVANFILTVKLKPSALAQRMLSDKEVSSRLTRRVDIKRDELTSDQMHSVPFLSEKQQEGLKDYLQIMIHLKENVDTIISTLKSQQSTIQELETPEITLRRLSDVFDDSVQDKGDVLGWFSDNQCDLIISLAEQKWSWKTITTAITAIALGVAQIALGAVLAVVSLGSGSFICTALISEGVSDMIFGIEGLVKGHCNWSEYFDNKIMSLAITVATAGVGTLFARGREASKYAYKAFGVASKELVEATAKETGKSLSKVMAKEVAKDIGKEVASAVVDAGINLATDVIVDQLSQAIDRMSELIIDCFDTMCQDQELRKKMRMYLMQQVPDTAEIYLHQITMRILQRRTFLDVWDFLEDRAKNGADVLTQGHGQASSHLHMCGEKRKGQRFMKGIGYVSRFAPLVTEMMKGVMIKKKMEDVKKALKDDLTGHIGTEHDQPPLDETRIKQIEDTIDRELKAMKHYFSQEVSQRGKKIVTTGIQIVSHELKKRAIHFGKEHVVDPLKRYIDISQFNHYENKLEAAKSDKSHSQIKAEYEGKMKKLMARTRSPEVFARMIEHHDALLGPAFAIPALEILIGRPIEIVTESKDGETKPILNVQEHYAKGKPIQVKFIPERNGQPGHFYFGGEKFIPQQHGNNCLIHAVLAGAGQKDMDVGQVRKCIAEACCDRDHPCHGYITRGIARNYIRMGVVGGSDHVTFDGVRFKGKAPWYTHLDCLLFNDWGDKNGPNVKNSKVQVAYDQYGNLNPKLNRCHRLSEKSIQEMVANAIASKDVANVKLLRQYLLPTIEDVYYSRENSFLTNPETKKAFMDTYADIPGNKLTASGEQYKKYIAEVDGIIARWPTGWLAAPWNWNWNQNPVQPGEFKKLVSILSNSPVNVSLGHAATNHYIGEYMDYNPGTPRSEGIRDKFKHLEGQGFYPPKTTEDGKHTYSSFWSGRPTAKHYD